MKTPFAPSFLRVSEKDVLRRLALLACILLSGGNLIIPRLPLAILVLLIAIHAFGFLSSRINTRKALIYAWLLLVMVFAFLREQHVDVTANVTRVVNFTVALAILKIYWGEAQFRFVGDFRAILMPIAVIGIITAALAVGAPGLFALVHVGSQRMFTLVGIFNYAVPLVEAAGLPRPMGFFWEPGVFAAHLNILLFILFVRKERLIAIAVVFGSILLTQSTSGIGAAVLQALYFVFISVFKHRLKTRNVFIVAVALSLAPMIFTFISQNAFDKFSGASVGSFTARNFDLSVALNVIEEHPVIGIGFSEHAYMRYSGDTSLDTFVLSEIDRDGRFNTNGVMIALYSVGLPLGVIFLAGLLRQNIIQHRLIFGGVLLFLLSSHPLALAPLFCFFAFSGLVLRTRANWSEINEPTPLARRRAA